MNLELKSTAPAPELAEVRLESAEGATLLSHRILRTFVKQERDLPSKTGGRKEEQPELE